VIDPRFVYLAVFLSAIGGASYVRDTLRGTAKPNRVSWSLWGLEGVLGFGVELQQGIGIASLMTLMLGLVPCVVVLASFKSPQGVWKIGAFDIGCGAISIVGLGFWAFVHQPTVALVAFVSADMVAALPTFRKAWLAPSTETPRVFVMGCLNCVITLLTLKLLTTAGALYPLSVAIGDFVLAGMIISRVGPRVRRDPLVTPRTSS